MQDKLLLLLDGNQDIRIDVAPQYYSSTESQSGIDDAKFHHNRCSYTSLVSILVVNNPIDDMNTNLGAGIVYIDFGNFQSG